MVAAVVGAGLEEEEEEDGGGRSLGLWKRGAVRSTCPRSRPGSMTLRTRRLSSAVSGKPPSTLRSQRTWLEVVVVPAWGGGGGAEWVISTTKTPPVEGWRATSPREVEKVDSSSWANLIFICCQRNGGEMGRHNEGLGDSHRRL